jgi:multiple sugar transport system substrate-binding protein
MTPNLSRRRLLEAVALSAALVGVPRAANAAPEMRREQSGSRQEQSTLSVAILDDHWAALEPYAKVYAETSGIEIEATPLAYEELYSQLSLALTQRAPTFDVVSLVDPWVPQFASFLSPIEIDSDLADSFVPVSLSVCRYPDDAQPCALPWLGEAQSFAFWSNWLGKFDLQTLETWDQVVETATTVAEQLDIEGDFAAFGMRTLTGHQLVESFDPVLHGYGVNLIDPDTSVPQLDTPEALAALEAFLTLAALSSEESSAAGAADNAQKFVSGAIAMMANVWSSDLLAAPNAEVLPDAGTLASTLQPAQSGVARKSMTGIWVAGIPVGSLAPDLARAFTTWMVSLEAQAVLPSVGLPPVRTEVLNDPALLDRFPDLTSVADLLERATPRPRSPFYPQLEQLVATELAKAVSGELAGVDALKNANVAIREFLVREGVLDA